MWSSIVLFAFLSICGEFFYLFLLDFYYDQEATVEVKRQVFQHFGTYDRTIFTMFELTLASWVPVCRLLMDKVSVSAGCAVLVFKVVVGFALMRVIVGVFLLETFKTAASDDELMIAQTKRSQLQHALKMKRFLMEADKDSDGLIEKNEFKAYLRTEGVRPWLTAQGIDEEDDELLFSLLDTDGNGKLTPTEVSRGISRLKGPARSMDVVSLMHMVSLLQEKCAVIAKMFEAIQRTMVGTAHGGPVQHRDTLDSPLLHPWYNLWNS